MIMTMDLRSSFLQLVAFCSIFIHAVWATTPSGFQPSVPVLLPMVFVDSLTLVSPGVFLSGNRTYNRVFFFFFFFPFLFSCLITTIEHATTIQKPKYIHTEP